MSWTDAEKVRRHLLAMETPVTDYRDVLVAIDASGSAQLPHRGVKTGSETVKLVKQLAPSVETNLTLNGETWKTLSYTGLFPGEIVIADDATLENIYQLLRDYLFDPAQGRVRRIAGGSIGDGATVQAYYRRFENLIANTDYTIDYTAGTIDVVPGGKLNAEGAMWVDYSLSAAAGVDTLIPDAITEAEDLILARLKAEYTAASTDQGLVTGATALATAVVCRGMAAHALLDGASSPEGRARGWRELAARFEDTAWRALSPFFAVPVPVTGSRKGNQSWQWF